MGTSTGKVNFFAPVRWIFFMESGWSLLQGLILEMLKGRSLFSSDFF